MPYIKHYYQTIKKTKNSSEELITDFKHDFIVHKSNYDGLAIIRSKGNVLARTLPYKIELGGEIIETTHQKFIGSGWLINKNPDMILTINHPLLKIGTIIEINKNPVAKITTGGGFLTIFSIIKHKNLFYEPPYMMIEFDEDKLDPLIALCVLLMDSCDPVETI